MYLGVYVAAIIYVVTVVVSMYLASREKVGESHDRE